MRQISHFFKIEKINSKSVSFILEKCFENGLKRGKWLKKRVVVHQSTLI